MHVSKLYTDHFLSVRSHVKFLIIILLIKQHTYYGLCNLGTNP